jgi:SAM-dependent methyltransferase
MNEMSDVASKTHEQVQTYYGKTLKSSEDLQTDACSTAERPPRWLRQILSQVHDEVLSRYFGCGLVAPESLTGMRILDLGSGSGRDVYALSALVGESGAVVGVDMTDEQLEIAQTYQAYHAQVFGHRESNVSFYKGYIERLDELPLAPGSFDIVVSNCVLNLAADKQAVLDQVHRLLKPGGEFYFSDVYTSRRVPECFKADPLLYGECLSGALYWNDFLSIAKSAGFKDPRLVTDRPLLISNEQIIETIGHIDFYSATYRLFKLDNLEPACEDYGQAVRYLGTIPNHPQAFLLDKHHLIEKGKIFPVCGNTWSMLKETRFAEHFEFIGDFSTHYGLFEGCGDAVPFDANQGQVFGAESGGCC